MRALLIDLHPDLGDSGRMPGNDYSPAARAEALIAREHTLALAKAMHDGGRLAPLLVCRKQSELHLRARDWGIAVLPLGGTHFGGLHFSGLAALVRLWLRQRKHPTLLIQTVGMEAASLGRRLLSLCSKKHVRLLSHAFFLRPPAGNVRPETVRKDLAAAQFIVCGSSHVKNRIAALWSSKQAADAAADSASPTEPTSAGSTARFGRSVLTCPACAVFAPGIALQRFAQAPRRPELRFIFGLLDCLQPRSGALAVLQAMAHLNALDDLPPWEVRMLGSGPRFNEVLDQARELGVDTRLCLLGNQDEAETLRTCSAFLAPGSSPEEPPTTLWAGFAAGLPVICSNSALHAERLRGQEEAAVWVDAYDDEKGAGDDGDKGPAQAPPGAALHSMPHALARVMAQCMREPDFCRELAARGKAPCENLSVEYTAARICRRLEELLRTAREHADAAAATATLNTKKQADGQAAAPTDTQGHTQGPAQGPAQNPAPSPALTPAQGPAQAPAQQPTTTASTSPHDLNRDHHEV